MSGRKKLRLVIHYLPIWGCIATGLIYLGIGVVAILSFMKLKQGGADESSLLAYLDDYLIGKMFIWVILTGTISYIIWRIFEAIQDPYGYGSSAMGYARRTGIGLSTIADALIAFTAVQVLLGQGNRQTDGQPREEREMVDGFLQEQSWGDALIISLGVIVAITAVVQFYYGITRGYRERLDIAHFSSKTKKLVHFLAGAGYLARGIILGVIGFFYIKAGITENASYVVNTDKAFDFIGDHVGHVYFILVAIGTIFYGFFMFTLGAAYDVNRED